LSTDYTDLRRLIFNKINWMKEIVHRLHRFTQINFWQKKLNERDCKQIYTDKFLTKEIEWKRLSTDYTDLHRLIFNKKMYERDCPQITQIYTD